LGQCRAARKRVESPRTSQCMGDIETARVLLRRQLSRAPEKTYIARDRESQARAVLGVIEGHPMRIHFGNRDEGVALLRQSIDQAREMLSSDPANRMLAASVALYRTLLAA